MCPTDNRVDATEFVRAPQFLLVDPVTGLDTGLVRRKENLLINGSFRFAQRQTPGTLTTYSNTSGRSYCADRWGVSNGSASTQFQRADASGTPETGLQARFYGTFKKITNATKVIVSQVIEGVQVMPVRGRVVRLQLKLKASTSMVLRVGLLYLTSSGTIDTIPATFFSAAGAAGTDPTWGTNLTAIAPLRSDDVAGGTAAAISGNGLSCSVTTAWQQFGATFLVPASCLNLVVVVFTNGLPAVNDTFSIAEAGLFDGRDLQDYVPRHYQHELMLCQRYFQKSFAVDTAPAQNVGANSGEFDFLAGKAAATLQHGNLRFPVTMRAAPTATLYNPAAANAQARNKTGAADCTSSSADVLKENMAHITATGDGTLAVGDLIGVHYALDAEL